MIREVVVVAACLAMVAPVSFGAELRPETETFYRSYLAEVESELAKRPHFLKIDGTPGLRQKVRQGQIHVQERRASKEPPGGLIHHWEGAVFIPRTTVDKVLQLVQSYDKHKDYYQPEVSDSSTLDRDGNNFRIRMRLLTKKIVTVALETEHKVQYRKVNAQSWESFSNSVKVAELENPMTDRQRELPPGTGHGYIWSMDSYWRFHEADGGVYMECSSISLSRDIPFGMTRLIRPMIDGFPEDSLRNVLTKTRTAVAESGKAAGLGVGR